MLQPGMASEVRQEPGLLWNGRSSPPLPALPRSGLWHLAPRAQPADAEGKAGGWTPGTISQQTQLTAHPPVLLPQRNGLHLTKPLVEELAFCSPAWSWLDVASTEGRSKAKPRPPSALTLGNGHLGHFKRCFPSYLFFPKFTVSLKKIKKNSAQNFCDLLCNEHAKRQNDIFSTKYLVPVIFWALQPDGSHRNREDCIHTVQRFAYFSVLKKDYWL